MDKKAMTNADILELFITKHPEIEFDDYRPLAGDMFVGKRQGITIFLPDGDIILYFPKEGDING